MKSTWSWPTIPTIDFDTWHTLTGVRPIQMMDNELAKELKQAGFPQSVHYNERGVADFLETDAKAKLTLSLFPPSKNL